ncbi:putative spermidine/putrescine transport system permease protein [Pseudomonas frederiksbergensis]|uniref:ABC transporter permease n=1 Tax=Pseudomonas frederiksbergensis TaxID=104087 RepID=UPI003D1F5692
MSEVSLTAIDHSTDKSSSLKHRLLRAESAYRKRSILLIAPLLLFLLISFVFPIGNILWKSLDNPEVSRALPSTLQALKNWDGQSQPDEKVFAALVNDLNAAKAQGLVPGLVKRLGYEDGRYRTLLSMTLRKLPDAGAQSISRTLIAKSTLWAEPGTWRSIQRAGLAVTAYYWLAAFDRQVDVQTGSIVELPKGQALYLSVLFRTLWIASVVTLFCVLLGYPVAYWLARQPSSRANLLLIMVLLPFWTSLLVRTAGWIVLLQNGGLINSSLIGLGLIEQPLQLVFNRVGVYISMTHILLPFVILPLYAVMKGISPNYVRAAISLGAHPFRAFWSVYVPQTFAGVTAGALLVFIMAIGYYITPALLGGPGDQMLSYFVAFYTNTTINWGMAAALGSQLLIIVLLLYWVYSRITRPANPAQRA